MPMTRWSRLFVWTGGGLFVLSLAACAYSYLMVWSAPAGDPFAWTRVSANAAVFAAPHLTADRLTFATVTTMYLCVAIPWEEQSLLRTFGDVYVGYQHTVRWRIVPYVY